ncbi:MAG: DUF1002 domain-containing protein [Clostridium sp.]
MKINKTRILSVSVAILIAFSFGGTAYADKPKRDTGNILVFGESLTDSQEQTLLKYFKAPKDTTTIYVTHDTIIKQLGLDPKDPENRRGGCYSSAYVELTEPSLDKKNSTGIQVKVNNLTEVTESMLINALITSGITSANVNVSSPFPVSGTSALSGILQGVEDVGGYEISLKQKIASQNEVETTLGLSKEIGDTEASTLMNEIKTKVIKEQPKSEKAIYAIVSSVSNKYDVPLTEESRAKVVKLMKEISSLDLKYDELKDTLAKASEDFKNKLEIMGKDFKESGFINGCLDWIKSAMSSISVWISEFGGVDEDMTTKPVVEKLTKPEEETPTKSEVENSSDSKVKSEVDSTVKVEDEKNFKEESLIDSCKNWIKEAYNNMIQFMGGEEK